MTADLGGIGMLIDDELAKLVSTEIAVIMNDGHVYRGTLKSFDDDILILENIFESSNQEIEWVETKDPDEDKKKTKGYLPWRKLTLPHVIIRLPMVLRIWPWKTE
jgi:small nuclear ribonucleoprotein (snRNP)-like protein